MSVPTAPRARHLLALTALCGVLFFANLGGRELWPSHEGRAAQNAQGLLDSGDWALPRLFDGTPEMQKPPLYYWLVAILGHLRDDRVDVLCVRLPAAVSGLLCVLLLYAFLAARGEATAGLYAGVVLAGSMHFVGMARCGRIDTPLTLLVSLLLCTQCGRPRVLVGAPLFALAILLKGLIALALPVVALGGWYLLGPADRRRNLCRLAAMALGGVLLAVPWFLLAQDRTQGEFLRLFFWHHHMQRAFGGSEALAAHPWWFYLMRFAIDFLPWSPLLLLGGVRAVRARLPLRDAPAEVRLGLVWLVSMMLLLSLSRFKRSDYLLPAFPGAALLLAGLLRWPGAMPEWAWRHRVRLAPAAVTLGAVLAVAGMAYYDLRVAPLEGAIRDTSRFADVIRGQAGGEEVLFFRVESHLLAFHVGRPIRSMVEWHDLNAAVLPRPRTLLTREEFADEVRRHAPGVHWELLASSRDYLPVPGVKPLRPLVLLRSTPPSHRELTRCPLPSPPATD